MIRFAKKIIWFLYVQLKWGRIFHIKRSFYQFLHKIKLKSCGKGVIIHPSVEIRSHENIEIADNVSINHNAELYGGGGITIGDGSMISYYAKILSDSRSFQGDRALKDPSRLSERIQKKTIIGKDVWIGANAIVLPGITVEDHAIVAAGAVVSKAVSSWDIVGGNPAKKIGNRLYEEAAG